MNQVPLERDVSMTGQTLLNADMVDLLRNHGISPTLQRLEIASALLLEQRHVTADQLLDEINRGGQSVSRATVYNTLRLLSSKGLIRELIVNPSRVVYEPKSTEHHHFYNINTGELTDFTATLPEMREAIGIPREFELLGVDVTVRVRGAGNRRDPGLAP